MTEIDLEKNIPPLVALLEELLGCSAIDFASLVPSKLPDKPGVYRIYETSLPADSVYIGQSTNIRNRLYRRHLMGNENVSTLKRKLVAQGRYADASKVKAYLRSDCSLQYLVLESEVERARLEHFAISLLRPWMND